MLKLKTQVEAQAGGGSKRERNLNSTYKSQFYESNGPDQPLSPNPTATNTTAFYSESFSILKIKSSP